MANEGQTGETQGGEVLESTASESLEGKPEGEKQGVVDPDSGFNYRDHIPEEFQGEKMWESVPDFKTLAKNYVNAQKALGASIRLPDEDAPAEEWDKIYDKLGRPPAPDKYEVEVPKFDEESGVQWEEDAINGFKKVAHQSGMNNKQLQAALNWYHEYISQSVADRNGSLSESAEALKEEWGGAYERKANLAQRAVMQVGGMELKEKLDRFGLLNDVGLAKVFAEVGEMLEQDGVIVGEEGGIAGREEAKAKIEAIRNDKDHPYNKPSDPGHKAAVAELNKLYQLAYD